MSRWPLAAVLAATLAGSAGAQQPPVQQLPPDEDAPAKPAPKSAAPPQTNQTRQSNQTRTNPPKTGTPQTSDDLPPDEDAASSAAAAKLPFNPVQSNKDVTVGLEYFKKGNFNAAAGRFRSATQYNDGNAQAWLWLGEAEQKRESAKAARLAYEKYLQLNPTAKNASDIKKRLEKLK